MTIDRIASRLVGHNALNRKFSGSARRSIMELRAHQFESGDESGNGLLSRQELVDCLKGREYYNIYIIRDVRHRLPGETQTTLCCMVWLGSWAARRSIQNC